MTPDQTCKNCKWWCDEGDGYGECRRHAPEVVRKNQPDAGTRWPCTHAKEFCGEHQPREEPHTPSAAFTQRVAELRAEARFEEHPKP